jgi:hemoglobin/transferrin/lactoferrin receptor protein
MSGQFSLSKLSLCLGLIWGGAVCAQPVADADVVKLKEVVVTATRNATDIDSTTATVTSIDRTKPHATLAADESELFKDEADIAFARDLRRHGATRINIRGIEDNRVVSLVDGVRLGDFYNGGGPTNFTQSSAPGVLPDFLKRIEIVRGPSSSLYGSDAIGGVVGYVTLDPADILKDGASTGVRLIGGYTGANEGLNQTILGAFKDGSAEVLLGYSHATGKETSNMGSVGGTSVSRSTPNRLRSEDHGVLGKITFQPATGHKISATLEGHDQQVDSNIFRMASSLPRVSAVNGEDNARRLRTSLEWEHSPADVSLYDRLTARLHQQDSSTQNYNFQNRTNTSATCSATTAGVNNCYIESDFTLNQSALGAGVQLEKLVSAGGVDHMLTYGVDLGRTRVEELRDTRVWNRTTGTFTKSLAGETYPLRDFAIGTTDTVGVYLQDEISGLVGGRLSLTPGIRFDQTRLTPEVDVLAQQILALNNRQAVAQTHAGMSPKIGGVWKLDSSVSTFGQISRGFRAPNYNEVNGVFRNTAQSYGVTPNADLKPETSIGLELGVRVGTGKFKSQFSAFDNRYQDFIDSVKLTCPGNPNCISGLGTTYQSVNLSKVRIFGAEARASWDFAPGWSTSGSLAWAQGSNEETGAPINSIEPMRMSASLTRDFGDWGVEGRMRAASDKDRTDDSAGAWFRPGGYAVSDVSVWWKIGRNAQLTVAMNNVFDKKYWLWSDIRQADASNPVGVDFYSQPGRSLSLALRADF